MSFTLQPTRKAVAIAAVAFAAGLAGYSDTTDTAGTASSTTQTAGIPQGATPADTTLGAAGSGERA